MTVPFAQLQTNDRQTNQLQINISQAVQAVLAMPQSKGLILTDVRLLPPASLPAASPYNIIPHKLGRKLQGWQIVRMRSNYSQIFDSQDTNTSPASTLNLNASAAVVVDIFVF